MSVVMPPLNFISTAHIHTPLMSAVKNQDLFAVKHLITSRADLDLINHKKKTALVYAVLHQGVPIMQTLLDAKANPTLGMAFISAVRIESIEVMHLLLQASAAFDPSLGATALLEQRDAFGQTPLMWAVAQRNIDQVKLLLQKNADVNAKNYKENTALIYAVKNTTLERQSSSSIVALLLAEGADIHARNKSGYDALFYARRYRNIRGCRQLFHAGARLPDVRFDDSSNRMWIITHNVSSSSLGASDPIAIAKELLITAHIPYNENNIRNHPLVMDIQEAITRAAKKCAKERTQTTQKLEAQYLLQILKEKYASQEETLTDEQLSDVIDQQARLKNHTLARENYDYSDYDPISLEVAVQAYHAHQERMRVTPETTDSTELQPTRFYTVIHYRIFGHETTERHYIRLRNAVKRGMMPQNREAERI